MTVPELRMLRSNLDKLLGGPHKSDQERLLALSQEIGRADAIAQRDSDTYSMRSYWADLQRRVEAMEATLGTPDCEPGGPSPEARERRAGYLLRELQDGFFVNSGRFEKGGWERAVSIVARAIDEVVADERQRYEQEHARTMEFARLNQDSQRRLSALLEAAEPVLKDGGILHIQTPLVAALRRAVEEARNE